jgi:hypothetical protein
MKAVTIRMPEGLLDVLRKKAAEETIRQNKQVSINTLALQILERALGKKKGG